MRVAPRRNAAFWFRRLLTSHARCSMMRAFQLHAPSSTRSNTLDIAWHIALRRHVGSTLCCLAAAAPPLFLFTSCCLFRFGAACEARRPTRSSLPVRGLLLQARAQWQQRHGLISWAWTATRAESTSTGPTCERRTLRTASPRASPAKASLSTCARCTRTCTLSLRTPLAPSCSLALWQRSAMHSRRMRSAERNIITPRCFAPRGTCGSVSLAIPTACRSQ